MTHSEVVTQGSTDSTYRRCHNMMNKESSSWFWTLSWTLKTWIQDPDHSDRGFCLNLDSDNTEPELCPPCWSATCECCTACCFVLCNASACSAKCAVICCAVLTYCSSSSSGQQHLNLAPSLSPPPLTSFVFLLDLLLPAPVFFLLLSCPLCFVIFLSLPLGLLCFLLLLCPVGSISGLRLWRVFSVRTTPPGAPFPYALYPLSPWWGQPPPFLLIQSLPLSPGKPFPCNRSWLLSWLIKLQHHCW